MDTFISHSPEETLTFGAVMGRRISSGLVLGLVGDLGAGKTHFVKGLAQGLGITEPVLSPTFALLHLYISGRLALYHLDFYRLQGPEQIVAAGLDEYFLPDGVTVVEWWDRWRGEEPPRFRLLTFETLSETERRITYDRSGA